ncbi:MAG: response regulator [bacterium]|nr:response regulator [bacterium]
MIRHVRVLVVDDDPDIVDVLTAFLRGQGYTVDHCSDGSEAMQFLEAEDYDLLVSDIQMAEMDGLELLQRARERHPHVGIVLMTAYDHEHPRSEAVRGGADEYIAKPFDLKKFSRVFERAYWNTLTRLESKED